MTVRSDRVLNASEASQQELLHDILRIAGCLKLLGSLQPYIHYFVPALLQLSEMKQLWTGKPTTGACPMHKLFFGKFKLVSELQVSLHCTSLVSLAEVSEGPKLTRRDLIPQTHPVWGFQG